MEKSFDPAGIINLEELNELACNNSDVQAQTTPSIALTLVSIMSIETTATVVSVVNGCL
ncbi:TPA: hypothetical protein P5P23_003861 [Clostridioides difficile]|nr:hypothetical protein [Clostridioides difficile]